MLSLWLLLLDDENDSDPDDSVCAWHSLMLLRLLFVAVVLNASQHRGEDATAATRSQEAAAAMEVLETRFILLFDKLGFTWVVREVGLLCSYFIVSSLVFLSSFCDTTRRRSLALVGFC